MKRPYAAPDNQSDRETFVSNLVTDNLESGKASMETVQTHQSQFREE